MSESIRLPDRLERRPVAELRASPRNPRRHDEQQLGRIVEAIRRYGWTNPVLIAPDGEIIAGEARWRAAQRLGLEVAPVIVLPHLDARQRDAVRIADNRLALAASWDEELLARILRDLVTVDEVDVSELGFTDEEIDRLFDGADPPPPTAEADAAVAPAPEPVTVLGDVWRLGAHRLVCGDATDPATFERLFAGSKRAAVVAGLEPADLVWTDPPYGMSYKGRSHGGILGDDARGAALIDLVAGAVGNARRHARPGAALYVCLTWRTWSEFVAALVRIGVAPTACIVWDKGWIGPGTLHYRPRHEFVLYAKGARWYGGAGEGDVWTVRRDFAGDYVHPTQKPVALVERALANSSTFGDVVLDVFGGSGSTLIACERLGRAARLVELDPKYCDAIVARWERFTGGRAERLRAETEQR